MGVKTTAEKLHGLPLDKVRTLAVTFSGDSQKVIEREELRS